ncbi:uncharacterized protein PAE49_007405 [Odontesthes bonariensis]
MVISEDFYNASVSATLQISKDFVNDWWPVQGVPRLSPIDRWDRLQPPRDPADRFSGIRERESKGKKGRPRKRKHKGVCGRLCRTEQPSGSQLSQPSQFQRRRLSLTGHCQGHASLCLELRVLSTARQRSLSMRRSWTPAMLSFKSPLGHLSLGSQASIKYLHLAPRWTYWIMLERK